MEVCDFCGKPIEEDNNEKVTNSDGTFCCEFHAELYWLDKPDD